MIEQGPNYIKIGSNFELRRLDDGRLELRGSPNFRVKRSWSFVYADLLDEAAHAQRDINPGSSIATLREQAAERLAELGVTQKAVVNAIAKALKKFVDPEHYDYAKALFGSQVTADAYNLAALNGEVLEYMERIDHGPLSGIFVAGKLGVITGTLRPRDIIEHAKGDLNKNEWRYFLKLDPALHTKVDLPMLRKVAQWSADCKTPIDPQSFNGLHTLHTRISQRAGSDKADALMHVALRHWADAEDQPATAHFLSEDCNTLADWLYGNPDETPEVISRRHYTGLMGRARQWHHANNRYNYRMALDATATWKSSIEETIYMDGLAVVPLITGADLIKEGEVMGHCVGTYAAKCKSGQSRIFSVRGRARPNEERAHVGTLELCPHQGEWSINQLYGPHNAQVSSEIRKVCVSMGKRYSNRTNGRPEPDETDPLPLAPTTLAQEEGVA